MWRLICNLKLSGARSSQRLSAPLRPASRAVGLDDACAQLEGSTYVMAEEAPRIISILTTQSGSLMVKDLVGAITHPLRSRNSRRGALQPSLSELGRSSFKNH